MTQPTNQTEAKPEPLTVPAKRILVACIGNIFLGDDGFGAVAPLGPTGVVVPHLFRTHELHRKVHHR